MVSSPPRRACRASCLEHGHDRRDLLPDNRPQTVAGLLNSRAIFRPDRLDLANLLIRQSEFLEVRDPEGEAVADMLPPIFLHRLDLLLLLGVEDIPHLGQLFLHERPHFLADRFNLGLLVVGELEGRDDLSAALAGLQSVLPDLRLFGGQRAPQALQGLDDLGAVLVADLRDLGLLVLGQVQVAQVRDPRGKAFNSERLAFLLHVFDLKQLLRRQHGAKLVQFFVDDALQSGNRLLELWRILVPDASTSFSTAACNNFLAPSCSNCSRKGYLHLLLATEGGSKELIAVVDGYRKSTQSWRELLTLTLMGSRLCSPKSKNGRLAPIGFSVHSPSCSFLTIYSLRSFLSLHEYWRLALWLPLQLPPDLVRHALAAVGQAGSAAVQTLHDATGHFMAATAVRTITRRLEKSLGRRRVCRLHERPRYSRIAATAIRRHSFYRSPVVELMGLE